MASSRRIGLVLGAALVAALVACGSFGESDAPAGADASAPPAAGADAAPDGAPVADGGEELDAATGGCFDLTTGKIPPSFPSSSLVVYDADGAHLSRSAGSSSWMKGTFTTKAPVRHATVVLDLRVELGTGTFGSTKDDYVDLLGQYLGKDTDYKLSATTALTIVSGGLDVDVWYAPGGMFDQSYPIPISFAGTAYEGKLTVETAFGDPGFVKVTTTATSKQQAAKTSKVDSTVYTLMIGGDSNGTVPDVKITIRNVCLTLS